MAKKPKLKSYTLQLGWWALIVIDQTVKASSPEEACMVALENPDYDVQKNIYDCDTETRVLELAEGVYHNAFEAPQRKHRPIPREHQDFLMNIHGTQKPYALDDAQHATVLAALRYYQEVGLGDPEHRSEAINDIATNSGKVTSLDRAGIDELCEQLNITTLESAGQRG